MDWWPRQAKKIQVDVDELRLGLTCPVDLGVACDAKEFVRAIIHKSNEIARDPEIVELHLSDARETSAAWVSELDRLTEQSAKEGRGLFARQALQALEASLKRHDPIICLDTGNLAALASSYMQLFSAKEPGLLGCGMWASCGPSVSYAIGAGFHQRPIIALTGEGAFMMAGVNEIVTAVREKIPIIVVILVNQMWGAEAVNQEWFFGNRKLGTTFEYNPNYAELAKSLGADGYRCHSANDVRNAVSSAMKKQSAGVVSVIEVLCSEQLGEPFRRDAMKQPHRVLDKYKTN
jgi:sulfoacetaldehyde acetyltransferase